jgi:uncharacterized protein (TIGR02186 family)
MKNRFLLTALPLFLLCGLSCPARGSSGEIHIQPSFIARTLLVKGTAILTLRGPAPEGSQIAIKVVGPDRDFRLNKAGKVLGILWAPVSHGSGRSLPGAYVLLSSTKLGEALSPEEQKAAGLFPDFLELRRPGKISLQEKVGPEEAEALSREFIHGLILLLREKGLYRQDEGGVTIAGGEFRAALALPADAPLGEYRVSAYILEGGKARLLGGGIFTVGAEGLAAWLTRQARHNPVFYGIVAVLIALGAGAFVGLIFQLGRRN